MTRPTLKNTKEDCPHGIGYCECQICSGAKADFERGIYEQELRGFGMCPWCGQALHPGRGCGNDD